MLSKPWLLFAPRPRAAPPRRARPCPFASAFPTSPRSACRGRRNRHWTPSRSCQSEEKKRGGVCGWVLAVLICGKFGVKMFGVKFGFPVCARRPKKLHKLTCDARRLERNRARGAVCVRLTDSKRGTRLLFRFSGVLAKFCPLSGERGENLAREIEGTARTCPPCPRSPPCGRDEERMFFSQRGQ